MLAALCRRGGPPFVAALAAARRWARARRLSGQHCTPNTFGWSVLAAHAAQQVGVLPSVDASSAAFADLAAASAPPEAWAALADASLGAVSVDGVTSLLSPLAHAGVHSPAGAGAAAAAPSPPAAAEADVAQRTGWLLYQIFRYFALEHSYRRRVVSLRSLALSKEAKGWTRRFDGALMIEDPLERDRDLGKLTSRAAVHAVRFDAATALLALASPSPASLGALCTPFDWRLREHAGIAGPRRLEHARRLAADAAAGALVAAPVAVRSAAAVAEMLAALRADGAVGLHFWPKTSPDTPSVLQLSTAAVVYQVELTEQDGPALLQALAPLLEGDVLKVTHDCRAASAALALGGVRLNRVFDVQATYATLRARGSGGGGGRGGGRGPALRAQNASLGWLVRRFLAAEAPSAAAVAEGVAPGAPPAELAALAAPLLPLHARLLLEIEGSPPSPRSAPPRARAPPPAPPPPPRPRPPRPPPRPPPRVCRPSTRHAPRRPPPTPRRRRARSCSRPSTRHPT